MPLKRSVVTQIKDKTQKAIYNFLKQHRDEVFTLEEIMKALSEDRISVRTALGCLLVNGKVRKFVCQEEDYSEDYFGIK